jgi:regulator of protease activity HflC (stomatin/prohibitin superfamily)
MSPIRLLPLSAALVLALSLGCTTIGPGRVGLLWRASDGTQKTTYSEGLHTVAPWNTMSVYDLRSMSHDEELDVIAVNGLTIKLNSSVRYRIEPAEVVELQQQIGPDYYEKILEPVLRSEARRVIGRYTPEEIYSTKRELIERELREGLKEKIAGKHLVLEAILIRNVELPPAIRTAIDQKLAAEQEVLKMKYVLELARAGAEQKRLEAEGIADYNRTISQSLGPAILEYERIQQLSQLAASGNAKMVVLGPGASAPTLVMPAARGEKEAGGEKEAKPAR